MEIAALLFGAWLGHCATQVFCAFFPLTPRAHRVASASTAIWALPLVMEKITAALA